MRLKRSGWFRFVIENNNLVYAFFYAPFFYYSQYRQDKPGDARRISGEGQACFDVLPGTLQVCPNAVANPNDRPILLPAYKGVKL